MFPKITNNIRSNDLVQLMKRCGANYAFIDYPDCIRYIISLQELSLGYLLIYQSNVCNIACKVANIPFGHQDTVESLITRAISNFRILSDELDLNSMVCPP